MNDQVDGKSLLGSYACNEVPGQFSWTNGIITKAVLSGDWLLIEDVDQAPPDVLSALEPLIQRRELHILSRGMVSVTKIDENEKRKHLKGYNVERGKIWFLLIFSQSQMNP